MRAETRHRLKHDRFSQVTMDAAEATNNSLARLNTKGSSPLSSSSRPLLPRAVAGGWYYLNMQDDRASLEVSQAVRVLDTPVRPANMPAQPGDTSYASVKERAADAQKKFQAVVDKYPHTHAAEVSRYFTWALRRLISVTTPPPRTH